jgi:hypothetical protein
MTYVKSSAIETSHPSNRRSANLHGELGNAAANFLYDQTAHRSILASDGIAVRFVHPLFQDFVAAKAIAQSTAKEQQDFLFRRPERLFNPFWPETARFVIDLLSGHPAEVLDRAISAALERALDQPPGATDLRCAALIDATVRMASAGIRVRTTYLPHQGSGPAISAPGLRDLRIPIG